MNGKYEGEWNNGRWNGIGIYLWDDNSKYDG